MTEELLGIHALLDQLHDEALEETGEEPGDGNHPPLGSGVNRVCETLDLDPEIIKAGAEDRIPTLLGALSRMADQDGGISESIIGGILGTAYVEGFLAAVALERS